MTRPCTYNPDFGTRPVVYGKTYHSLAALDEAYGKRTGATSAWLRHNPTKTLEDLVDYWTAKAGRAQQKKQMKRRLSRVE